MHFPDNIPGNHPKFNNAPILFRDDNILTTGFATLVTRDEYKASMIMMNLMTKSVPWCCCSQGQHLFIPFNFFFNPNRWLLMGMIPTGEFYNTSQIVSAICEHIKNNVMALPLDYGNKQEIRLIET